MGRHIITKKMIKEDPDIVEKMKSGPKSSFKKVLSDSLNKLKIKVYSTFIK